MDNDEIKNLMTQLDTNNDGFVDLNEFIHGLKEIQEEKVVQDIEKLDFESIPGYQNYAKDCLNRIGEKELETNELEKLKKLKKNSTKK